MLGGQGIAGEIQRKKEAYQGNPQALQQQYQQSQQLVDLLALQQLKSEKEAAARQMQMQMQQNPATIAQQREQEVLGMIKQEQGRKLGDVARRTAGTLGQINRRAQQNVQRTAKQGLPAMGGSQMAAGGIVGFRKGGPPVEEYEHTEEEIQAYIDAQPKIRRGQRGPIKPVSRASAIAALTEQKKALKKQKRAATPRPQVRGGRTGQRPAPAPAQTTTTTTPAQAGIAAVTKQPDPNAVANQAARVQQNMQQYQAQREAQKPPAPVDQTPYGTALAKVLQEGPLDNQLDENLAVGAKETEFSGKLTGILDSMNVSPEQMALNRAAAIKEADKLMGRSEGIETLKQQEKDLAAFDARYSDPDQLRSQALMAGLLSAGSGPLARAGAGMFNAEREQERQLRNMLKSRQELGQKRIDFTRLSGAEVLQEAAKVREQDRSDRRAAMTAYGTLSASEQARLDAESNRLVSIARGNQDARSASEGRYVDMLTSLAESERRRIDSLEARQQAGMLDAISATAEIQEIRSKILETKKEAETLLLESDPEYPAIVLAIQEAQEDEDPEALAAAKAQLNRLKAKAASDATALGVSELETKLDALEEALGTLISPSAPASPSTVKASDIVAARRS
tara:strand:+ start:3083 stop:4954 length:1872 start_codon:yes stop_codon:yes gene_type:complete